MHVLEAWFHPGGRADRRAVLLARVICSPGKADIQLVPLGDNVARPFDVTALKTKLRYLVENALPNVADELRKLRSDFWTFKVEGS